MNHIDSSAKVKTHQNFMSIAQPVHNQNAPLTALQQSQLMQTTNHTRY